MSCTNINNKILLPNSNNKYDVTSNIVRDERNGTWYNRQVWFPLPSSSSTPEEATTTSPTAGLPHSSFDFMTVREKQTVVFPTGLYPSCARDVEDALIRDLKRAFWRQGGCELSTQERTGQTAGRALTLRLRLRCANHTAKRGKCPFSLTVLWHLERRHWYYTAPTAKKNKLKHAATCAPFLNTNDWQQQQQQQQKQQDSTFCRATARASAVQTESSKGNSARSERGNYTSSALGGIRDSCSEVVTAATAALEYNRKQALLSLHTSTNQTFTTTVQSSKTFYPTCFDGGGGKSSNQKEKAIVPRNACVATSKNPSISSLHHAAAQPRENQDAFSADPSRIAPKRNKKGEPAAADEYRITLASAVAANNKQQQMEQQQQQEQQEQQEQSPSTEISFDGIQSSRSLCDMGRIFSDDLSQCFEQDLVQQALLEDAQSRSNVGTALFFAEEAESKPTEPLLETTDPLFEMAARLDDGSQDAFDASRTEREPLEESRKSFKRSRSNLSSSSLEDQQQRQRQDANTCADPTASSSQRRSTSTPPPPSDMISWDLDFPFSAPSA